MSPDLLALFLMLHGGLTRGQLVGRQTIEWLGKAVSNVVWPWPTPGHRVIPFQVKILVSWFPLSNHQPSERGFLPPHLKDERDLLPNIFDHPLWSHVIMLHAIQVSPDSSVSAHTKEQQVWVTEKPWQHLHKSVWETDMESSKLS